MTGDSVKMRINGIDFEVAVCPEKDRFVASLASGQGFSGGADVFNSIVDEILGKGAFMRISKGRRLDGFDLITLAVYICAKYMKSKESAAFLMLRHLSCRQ